MAYGVIYYRLLVGHAPLDRTAARSLAAELARYTENLQEMRSRQVPKFGK
jgi:hypothetical protein